MTFSKALPSRPSPRGTASRASKIAPASSISSDGRNGSEAEQQIRLGRLEALAETGRMPWGPLELRSGDMPHGWESALGISEQHYPANA